MFWMMIAAAPAPSSSRPISRKGVTPARYEHDGSAEAGSVQCSVVVDLSASQRAFDDANGRINHADRQNEFAVHAHAHRGQLTADCQKRPAFGIEPDSVDRLHERIAKVGCSQRLAGVQSCQVGCVGQEACALLLSGDFRRCDGALDFVDRRCDRQCLGQSRLAPRYFRRRRPPLPPPQGMYVERVLTPCAILCSGFSRSVTIGPLCRSDRADACRTRIRH